MAVPLINPFSKVSLSRAPMLSGDDEILPYPDDS